MARSITHRGFRYDRTNSRLDVFFNDNRVGSFNATGFTAPGTLTVTGTQTFGTHATWQTSADSAAVADQVSIGRYEIGGGNTVLAFSQETTVVGAVAEADFSHAVQVRFNGVSYFLMMASSLS